MVIFCKRWSLARRRARNRGPEVDVVTVGGNTVAASNPPNFRQTSAETTAGSTDTRSRLAHANGSCSEGGNGNRTMSKLALLVAGTFFMEFLDATILTTALPRMAESMRVGAVDLNVGVSIYSLTIAVFILPSAWLVERFGAQMVFTSAIVLFTASSIACGFANTPLVFDAARAVQGVGGALMVPVGRIVVLRTTVKSDLILAVAIITWPGLTAPLVGPPLGGSLADAFSWRAIFFVCAARRGRRRPRLRLDAEASSRPGKAV